MLTWCKAKEEDDSDSVSRCTDNARDEAPEMPVAQESWMQVV